MGSQWSKKSKRDGAIMTAVDQTAAVASLAVGDVVVVDRPGRRNSVSRAIDEPRMRRRGSPGN